MAVYSDRYKYIFFANPNTASKAIAKTLREKLEGRQIPEKEVRDGDTRLVRRHHATYTQLVSAGLMTEEKLAGLFKFTCVRNPFDQMVSKYVKHCARLDNDASRYPWLRADKKAEKQGDKADAAEGKPAKTAKAGKKTAVQAVAAAPAEASDPAAALKADFSSWLRHIDSRFAETSKIEKGPMDFISNADYVIRFEALQDGFLEVQKRVGISPPVEVEEFNVTAARAESPKKKRGYSDYYTPESVAIVERMFAPVIAQFGYRFDQ